MKTYQKKKFPKKIIVIVAIAIVLVLIAGALTYVYAFNGSILGWNKAQNTSNNSGNINYGPATTEQQQAGAKTKSGSNSDTPPTPTTVPGSNKKNVQVAITSANPNSPNGPLQIRAQISAVDDTGVCTLTLTSSGKTTVTKTANTQPLASISTCKGFDVPLSELSVGTWSAQIQYSSSTLSGSTSQDIVIK
ncbi:MAG: hypothetical protein NTV39_00275 [Candidatus Saccharibacteria bacterium]|nr:hypothetical protein [Candidatus Saccharibacteria bacterium]